MRNNRRLRVSTTVKFVLFCSEQPHDVVLKKKKNLIYNALNDKM